jgi:hypothetical protein
VLLAEPVFAHHSGAAFDPALRVNIEGVVTKIEWTNPHARLYVAVKDDSGAQVDWEFELPSVNRLVRSGWTKSSLGIGEHVTVIGSRARAHPYIALALNVTNAKGVKLFRAPATAPPASY